MCAINAVVRAQDTTRIFDMSVGHMGEGGGLLEYNGTLYSGAQDTRIKMWDIKTGQLISTVTGHTNWVTSFAIAGSWLFSGSRDSTIRQWTLNSMRPVRTINVGAWVLVLQDYNGVIYSGDRAFVITAWDINTGTVIRRFTGHTGAVRAIAINNDVIYSGSEDRTVRMWNIASGVSQTLNPSTLWVMSMMSANGRLYVAGDERGGIVREWTLDGTFVRDVAVTSMAINSLKVKDSSLITSSFDGIKLWELNMTRAATFKRDLTNIYNFNLESSNTSFYSISSDGCSIRRWNWTDVTILWAVPPNYAWSATTTDGTSLWGGRNNGQIW